MQEPITKELLVENKMVVMLARRRFCQSRKPVQCRYFWGKDGERINGKSIMGMVLPRHRQPAGDLAGLGRTGGHRRHY